jgi:hypothetical protein
MYVKYVKLFFIYYFYLSQCYIQIDCVVILASFFELYNLLIKRQLNSSQ